MVSQTRRRKNVERTKSTCKRNTNRLNKINKTKIGTKIGQNRTKSTDCGRELLSKIFTIFKNCSFYFWTFLSFRTARHKHTWMRYGNGRLISLLLWLCFLLSDRKIMDGCESNSENLMFQVNRMEWRLKTRCTTKSTNETIVLNRFYCRLIRRTSASFSFLRYFGRHWTKSHKNAKITNRENRSLRKWYDTGAILGWVTVRSSQAWPRYTLMTALLRVSISCVSAFEFQILRHCMTSCLWFSKCFSLA